ncbi:MAG: glycosyltransferase family 39 protein, partial [Candidatus Omnitrophica bacterium]|nr:glycosyltransferase family 39 protein [Candidatus Omnitrophota bacterium]
MKRSHRVILGALFLFYAVNNYIWLSQNKLPVSYDEGIHLWTSLRFVRAFLHPAHSIFYELIDANTTHWPPLFYFIASLFNLIFGLSYIVSVMTNMLFFLILIVSLYLIGKKLYSPFIGVLSATILSFYPIIYGHSRLFQLDFALTAIVTLSIYCLISTDRFRSLLWSIIFCISAAIGMLIKWSYIIFILPLVLYMIIACLSDSKIRDFLYRLKKLLIALAISFIIPSLWYIKRNRGILSHLRIAFENTSIPTFENIRCLILSFNNSILSFIFFLLFIVCLAIFYIKSKSKFKVFFTIWSFIPLILLSFIKFKQARFFMPVLPCFALISAIGIDLIGNKRVKNIVVIFVFSTGLMQYFNSSFTYRIDEKNKFRSKDKNINILYKPYLEGVYSIIGAAPPRRIDWRQEDIAKSFAGHIQELKDYPFIMGIIWDENNIGLNNLFANRVMNYYVIKELMRSDAVLSGEIALAMNQKDETKKFLDFITDMQGVVYISKNST